MAMFSAYCKSCGLCCKYAFVLPEEGRVISEKLGLPSRRLLKKVGRHFVIDADPCPFLTGSGCSIEAEKPACCMVFPLILESDGVKFYWKVSCECPMKDEIPKGYVSRAEAEGRKLLEYHEKNVLNAMAGSSKLFHR